jgi:hypothetical protein
VEEYPLVPLTDTEYLANIVARESLDISQDHDLALPGREIVECVIQATGPGGGDQPVIGVRPRLEGLSPRSRRVKARGMYGGPSVSERIDGMLTPTGRLGSIDKDAEQPGLEAGPPLEAIHASHDPDPRFLDGFLGHSVIRDIASCHSLQGVGVPPNKHHKRLFIASSHAGKEVPVVLHEASLGSPFGESSAPDTGWAGGLAGGWIWDSTTRTHSCSQEQGWLRYTRARSSGSSNLRRRLHPVGVRGPWQLSGSVWSKDSKQA